MMKRVVFSLFVLLTFFSITAQAEESIDYLYNQSLVEHGNTVPSVGGDQLGTW